MRDMIAGTGSFADHGELGSSRHNMRIFEPVRSPDATSRKVCSGSGDHGAGDESCIQRSPSLGASTNSNVECGGGGGQFRNHYTPPDHFGSFHSIATPATTGAGGYISSSATSSTALGAGASGFGTTETGGEGPISDHGNNRSLITPSTATTTASTWQPGSAAPEATRPHDNAIPSELILMPPGNEATSVTSLTELHLPAVEPFHIQFDRRSDSSSLLDERQSDRSSAYSAHWWRRRGILTTRVMPPACTLDLERRSAASSDADRTYVSRTLTTQTQSSTSRSETDSRSRNSVSQDPSKTHTQEDDNDRESSRGGGGAASRLTRSVVRGAPDLIDSVFGFGRQTSHPAEDHVVGVRIIDHSNPCQHVDGAPATSSSWQVSERSPPAAARGARDPDPNAYHAQGAPIPANAPVRSRTTASDPAVADYIRRPGKTKRSTVDGNVPGAAPDSLSNSKERLPLVSEEDGAATSPRPLGDEEVDLTTSSYYEYAQQMGARPLDFDDASDHTYASHPSHISRATSATIPFHPLGSEGGASRAGSAASRSSNSRTTSARAYPMQQGQVGVALIQHDTHLHEPSSSSRSRTLQRAAQGREQEQEANAPNQGPHRKDQVLSWDPAADSEEIDDDSLPALSPSARNIVPGQSHSSFFPTSLSPEAQKIALQRAIQQAVVTMETPVSFLLQVGGDNAAGGGRTYFAGIGAPEEEGGIMRGIKTSTKQQYWALNTALADSYLLNGEHLLDG